MEIFIDYSTQNSLRIVVPISSRWNGAHSKKKEVEIRTNKCSSASLHKCQFLNNPLPKNNRTALIHYQSSIISDSLAKSKLRTSMAKPKGLRSTGSIGGSSTSSTLKARSISDTSGKKVSHNC